MVVENLPTRFALNEDETLGHYAEDTQPDWDKLKWDNTDSVAVNVADMLPAETVKRTMATAPRYTIEERNFIRDSLTTGIGVPTGVYQFNVTGQGTGSSSVAKVMLLTVYAKRYN